MAAQTLFDALLLAPDRLQGGLRKVAIVVSTIGIGITSRLMGDPIVTRHIHGMPLRMPMSHALPLILARYPHYSSNIGRIARLVHQRYPDMRMIDIGANIGDTVAMVYRFVHVPVLCIDGDARFHALLQQNLASYADIEIECAFVAADSGRLDGELVSDSGSGHWVPGSGRNIHSVSLSDILSRHSEFRTSKLLKVDTDGFDTLILKGALDLLGSMRPVLFFEYDPHYFLPHDPAGFEVFEQLRQRGYSVALFYENTGEFLTHVPLDAHAQLQDLHAFCSGRMGKRYFDVCLIHEDDANLADSIRNEEHRHGGRALE